jgi:hypothetical protein
MLAASPFAPGASPFVDYNFYAVIGNFQFNGKRSYSTLSTAPLAPRHDEASLAFHFVENPSRDFLLLREHHAVVSGKALSNRLDLLQRRTV